MTIEVTNLSFSYESGVEALKDISLTLNQGETVALLGHNGSGKSTLVRHFNGLLHPTSGSVKVNGILTVDEKVSRLAGMVAMLFQNPDDQICKPTVWDEITFGPKYLGYETERIKELGDKFLSSLGLQELKDCNPHDLGFSERKRLVMGSVLAMDTEIVVFDEPTAGLDPREISMLESEIRRLRESGRTVVIISHDMDFVVENCSRAICLENGRKQFDGKVADLFMNNDLLDRCGLLPPQVVQLSNHYGLQLDEISPQGFMDKMLV
ncbi:energy-coupling factor ABC transporter ATP-binding protein [Maridesulfovibrio salexigens]|uniref:ABC transporter related n=1 Tax=Maridesulfovibrio salexigens (strain ATCC 14822 / DSM 2638 / NCIMB 8403 / VKM B-1763) TaxID=526222 RepID=C6BT84_MARSD|nr:ABC transporter ATP-binding protein [Maridesulfovibrio salexigens]ACS81565.1 ABC transporter related [Maridesulfovibrio salexigens DSM 2638]